MVGQLFRSREYRQAFVKSHLSTQIAAEIKANRERRNLSQEQLGELVGMKQSEILRLEDVNYESWSLSSLQRLAEAMDLVLSVRFESYSEFLDDFLAFGEDSLAKPSFEEDPGVERW